MDGSEPRNHFQNYSTYGLFKLTHYLLWAAQALPMLGSRAIDFHEGDEIDEDAFKTLIRAAAALNRSSAR